MATTTKMTTTRIGINPPLITRPPCSLLCTSMIVHTRSRRFETKLNKKRAAPRRTPPEKLPFGEPYIMPPMPPPGMPIGASSSGSATTTSVVTMSEPMEAAFCSAERVTIAGSMTPAFTRSSYSLVRAL